ncbi:Gfo/Idh/MocA family protein [Pontiella sulfatireligans]|uniref:Inositol 2-dehydrogenase n=1 Tax=Pontiella sulfatireligans TaxID=2750658 RepID=A0A6C2UFD6_9BACT|nr:Gfo/Idh/MocA family oxidoreductase [Pontiella sulfatireligans]VGO18828.1 Inositol 2-dehydrogenase [Pontiella sulfatireligans]
MNRKNFIGTTAAGALFLPSLKAAAQQNAKLRVACVGVGGMGFNDLRNLASRSVEIVGICDLDSEAIRRAKTKICPDAKTFTDFRIMLRELKGDIDAVSVSTPDHTHFPIAMMAMQMNKHVYVQKPLAHTAEEVRIMVREAQKRGLVTQMGNQGHAFEGIRLIREWYEAGLIGEVKEVVAWTNRPERGAGFMPERMEYPLAEPVPEGFDWDLWVGPVADAPPYASKVYHNRYWRGWWSFGMGGLGDIGCHTLDTPFWSLDLQIPHKVEVEVDHVNPIFTPSGSVVKYFCKQKKTGRVIPMTWYEGPKRPAVPESFGEFELNAEGGLMLVGTKGIIYHPGMRPDSPRLFPEELWQEFRTNPEARPKKSYPRIKGGHIAEWVRACLGEGAAPGSNFDYAGRLSMMIILGTLAIRTGKNVDYDIRKGRITNNLEADKLLKLTARKGFRAEDLRIGS